MPKFCLIKCLSLIRNFGGMFSLLQVDLTTFRRHLEGSAPSSFSVELSEHNPCWVPIYSTYFLLLITAVTPSQSSSIRKKVLPPKRRNKSIILHYITTHNSTVWTTAAVTAWKQPRETRFHELTYNLIMPVANWHGEKRLHVASGSFLHLQTFRYIQNLSRLGHTLRQSQHIMRSSAVFRCTDTQKDTGNVNFSTFFETLHHTLALI
jgi:hypothetical protein